MKEYLIGAVIISSLALTPISANTHLAVASLIAPDTATSNISDIYGDYYGEYEHEVEEDTPIWYRTTVRLNLRRGPGTGYDRIITTNPGQLVYVTDVRDGEWFAVEVNGQAGYMYTYFLEEAEAPTEEELSDEIQITATNGPVERIPWSQARNVLTRGQAFTVVDVRTGITWQMASFSHGNHADVEPVTAADTAAMLRAWGGRWCWTPRPIQVHVNGRVLAASLNGMPHAGSTNNNNNMRGHVCMHFYGSRTHNGNRSHERDHQNAVNEAFRAGA